MNSSFHARRWLNSDEKEVFNTSNSTPLKTSEEVHKKKLTDYIISGWTGEGLLSKSSLFTQQLLKDLSDEALYQFILNSKGFNRSLKVNLFNEFVNYTQIKKIDQSHEYIKCSNVFWNHISKIDIQSKTNDIVDNFAREYTFQVAVIYLLKVRLAASFLDVLGISIDEQILNPSSILTKIFPLNSSRELPSDALKTNIYSKWFRPKGRLASRIQNSPIHLNRLSISELSKILSGYYFNTKNLPKDYSHSLSHQEFGIFLNFLILNFSSWQNNAEDFCPFDFNRNAKFKPLLTKYQGDYIPSLAMGHWLAQHQKASQEKWSQVICPQFQTNEETEQNDFLRISYELQYIHSLIFIAKSQNEEPISFITNLLQSAKKQAKEAHNSQFALFDELNTKDTFHRCVLNFCKIPFKNPHFHLVKNILDIQKDLKEFGYLFVLSNQNFLVPSQNEKVQQVLDVLDLKAVIHLDELKGRGEIPTYLYIFRKVEKAKYLAKKDDQEISSCVNLRFIGELNSFKQFSSINQEIPKYFKQLKNQSVSIISRRINEKLTFEAYADAIKDGRLISSANKDSSQIAHPRFFSQLVANCVRFNNLFELINITEYKNQNSEELFAKPIESYNESPYIVIVDQRDDSQTHVDVSLSTTLPAKIEHYGHALCHYFGIKPKYKFSINLIKNYFKSPIGLQIIRQSFASGNRKIKSSLSNFLIPKFLIEVEDTNSTLNNLYENIKSFQLESISPDDFKDYCNSLFEKIEQTDSSHPKSSLYCLESFQIKIESLLNEINQKQNFSFSNPYFTSRVCKLTTSPIYPNNDELSVNFHSDHQHLMSSKLTSTEMEVIDIEGEKLKSLTLYSNDQKIVSFYSKASAINFLDYIMQNCLSYPINKILIGVSIPKLQDLDIIIDGYYSSQRNYTEAIDKITKKMNQIYSRNII